MSDKAKEFLRINEPRIERAVQQIELVEKSAMSMRVEPELFQELIKQVQDKVSPGNSEAPVPQSPGPVITTPIAKEMTPMEDMSTQQLVDRMIACGAELARRRK